MACSPGSAAPPANDSQDEPVQIAPTTMVAGETHCAARPTEIAKRSAAPCVHSLPNPNSNAAQPVHTAVLHDMIGPNSSTNWKVPAEVFSSAAQPADVRHTWLPSESSPGKTVYSRKPADVVQYVAARNRSGSKVTAVTTRHQVLRWCK